MSNEAVLVAIAIAVIANIAVSLLNGRRNSGCDSEQLHENHEHQAECLQVLRDNSIEHNVLLQQLIEEVRLLRGGKK